MKNFTKKILVLLVVLMMSLGFVACDLNPTTTTTTLETTSTTTTTTNTSTTSTTTTTTTTTTLEVTSSTTTTTTTVPTTTTTTTTTTTFIDNSRIEIISPTVTVFEQNGALNLSGMVVTYYNADNVARVLAAYEYQVGSVDMSTLGIKTVTVTYLGRYTATFTIEIVEQTNGGGNTGGSTDPYTGTYYQGVDDSNGTILRSDLHTLLSSTHHGISYGDARYILDETDRDPNNPSNIILVYTRASISGVWDSGSTWNREHVWPKSFLPDTSVNNGSINSASDLHNLKPSNVSENSYRSNKYFSAYDSSSVAYEPHDDVKGDVARIMFYMAVRYNLTLVNTDPNYLEMGMLDELLAWHIADPVDAFEMNRNEVIFSYQENRNPFIDHPEWVQIIWN